MKTCEPLAMLRLEPSRTWTQLRQRCRQSRSVRQWCPLEQGQPAAFTCCLALVQGLVPVRRLALAHGQPRSHARLHARRG